MSHLGSLQVECLSIVTEEHDVFLQVTQAPVLMITNSFLMEILDETEERVGCQGGGGGLEVEIPQSILSEQSLIFPLSSP